MHFVTLRYGILTIGTWDSFFPSSCFSGQNGMLSATEQNQTYHNSFFFIIVFLQFSIKFCFSGCLVLITNSKLVISVGKRRGFSRRFWLLIKELLIARDADRRNKTPYINVSFLEFDFLESHRLLDNPLTLPQISI